MSSEDLGDVINSLVSSDPQLSVYEDQKNQEVKDWIPTCIPTVDAALEGGIPASGSVSEVFGVPGAGKSTFYLLVLRNFQKLGGLGYLFDIEETTPPSRAAQLGVDPSKMISVRAKRDSKGTVHPITVEQIGEKIIRDLAAISDKRPGQQVLFIWDSVAFTLSNMEESSDLDSSTVAGAARAINTVMRKVQPNLKENGGTLLAVNQARDDLNAPNPRYKQVKTSGGKGWEHVLSDRIQINKGKKFGKNASDKAEIGRISTLVVRKTKVGDSDSLPFEGVITNRSGFDLGYNLYQCAFSLGLITGSNPKKYVTDNGELFSKSMHDFRDYLSQNQDSEIFKELWQKCVKAYCPQCYPPLFNENLEMTVEEFPFIEGLREYYIDIQEKLPVEQQNFNYRNYVETHGTPKKKGAKK